MFPSFSTKAFACFLSSLVILWLTLILEHLSRSYSRYNLLKIRLLLESLSTVIKSGLFATSSGRFPKRLAITHSVNVSQTPCDYAFSQRFSNALRLRIQSTFLKRLAITHSVNVSQTPCDYAFSQRFPNALRLRIQSTFLKRLAITHSVNVSQTPCDYAFSQRFSTVSARDMVFFFLSSISFSFFFLPVILLRTTNH